MLTWLTEALREVVLREGMDCFTNLLPSPQDRLEVARYMAGVLEVHQERVEYLHLRHKPDLKQSGGLVQVGRVYLEMLEALSY
jgi:hypothetical protein